MRDLLNFFKIIGDENRLRILLMLKIRPLCVCEIHEALSIALSTISQHLKLMKSAGLIEDSKDGRWVIYSLKITDSFQREILDILEKKMKDDPQIMKDRNFISTTTREICSIKFKSSQKQE